MAVQDPPPPQQPPPIHPQVQRLIDAAQVGATVQAAGAATVAPGVAVALPAVAAAEIVSGSAEAIAHGVKIALVLRILRRLLRRHRTENLTALEKMLRQEFPDLDPAAIRRIVEQEIRYEDAFGRKATQRVENDMQAVGQLQTAEKQAKRIQEILAREAHYSALREQAMLARARQRAHNETVRMVSPDGAKWVLGAAKNHTLGCLALAGKNWPWSVLDTIPPPLHTNCQCSLQPLGPNDTVPPAGEAMAAARRAMALEEAVRAVADPGEIEACLDGLPVRPTIERAILRLTEVDYREALHPRGRGGRWTSILGKLKAAKMDDITDVEGHSVIRTSEGYSVRVGTGKRATGTDPEKIADAIEAHLTHRATLGDEMTLANMDENYQRWFSPQQLDGGREPHPKSGYNLQIGKWLRVQQPAPDTDGPPVFKVTDYGEHAGEKMFPEVVGTEPIRELYRGMSVDEWNQAVRRGYIQSDMRGAITDWEGTNAGVDPQTAHSYLPYGAESVIAKISVRPQDGWFTRNEDGYLRTREAIPISQVTARSPVLFKSQDEGTFVRPDSTSAAKLTSGANDDRSRETQSGSVPGSSGGRRGDLVRLAEVDASTEAGYRRYLAAIRANPNAEFVTAPSQEELAAKRVWLNADDNVGVTVAPDGEIGNLFRNPGAPPGAGSQALDHAVANGGTWLNAYAPDLPRIYAKHGFVEVARLKFDPAFKPEGWDMETLDSPPIVFMRHGGVANPGNYVQTWDDGEAAVQAAKLQEAFDESLHPRDRTGRWSFLGRLHTLTRSDIEAGHVPGVQVAGLASGVAGHAGLGGRPITLAPSGFDKQGRVSSVLLAHEAGHHLVNTVIKDGKVPPEMEALRAGVGRAAGRYGAMAGNAHLFENPWKAGERDLPEEMIADGYADLLHGGAEFRYDGPPEPEKGTREHEWWAEDVAKDRAAFEETPKVKLLKVIAAAARENGMPDHALYTFEFTGPMSNREATLVLREADLQESFFDAVLHPRGRGGKWVDAIQHAETTHAEPSVHEGFTGEDFATALSGFSHGGITAMRGNRTDTQNLYGDVWLNLHKPGGTAPVGLIRVTLKPPDHRGERTAVIENVYLKESEQNQGFGRAFTDHLFKMLKEGGVDRIALEAISVGGYSWARRGFVWDGDHAAEQRRILDDAKRDGRWDAIKEWPGADELERKLLAGEFTSEAELAAYGMQRWTAAHQPQDQMSGYTQPERERTWLGRELMIGSRWKGSRPVVVPDALQETRLLQERAEETHLTWDPIKHRRGWHGHFADMLGELPKPSLRGRGGGSISLPDGHHVARTRHGYEVTRPSGTKLSYSTAEEAAKSVHDEYESARLEAEVKAERAVSMRERMERGQRKREEEIAAASKQAWYRFETPEIAHKLVADAAEGKAELWGLPGYQGRGNAAVRAQPRRPDDETIKHERANGRVLIEFHTKIAPDAGLDMDQPQYEWTPTASVQNRNAQRLGLQELRLEEEEKTKYGRAPVAKLKLHAVRIIDVGG